MAGSADAPESTDAAGDAGPNGTAAPAGHEDVDIVSAWLETETAATIDLVIHLSGPLKGRPNTLWGYVLDIRGTQKAAAYFDGPPFGSGGALCDYLGNMNVENCGPVPASASGSDIRFTLPRDNLTALDVGAPIALLDGVAFSFIGSPIATPVPVPGQSVIWDTVAPGLPYVTTKGVAANVTDDAAPNATRGAATNLTPAGSAAPSDELAEAPAAGAALAVAAAVAVAVGLRRRR